MQYRFAERVSNVPTSGIGAMMRYAARFSDTVSLGQGTPFFPTPSYIYDYVNQKAKTDPGVGQYLLAGLENELKDLIAANMEKLYGFAPKREELALSIGGLGGLFATFMSILNPGDEVIYFDPSYPLHLSQLAIAQAKVVFVSLEEERNWHLNLEKLTAAITAKTRAIILTNPNNPTGTVFTEAEVKAIIEICLKNDLYLVSDEAYHFLAYDNLKVVSPATFPEIRDRLILVKSFSKEFAMTGWRIGYVYASADLLAKIHYNVNMYTCVTPPTISVHAAIAALSDPRGEEAMQGFVQKFAEAREYVNKRMDHLHKLFASVKPEGAYYLFPKLLAFPELTAVEFCQKLIEEAGVITVPGDTAGPAGARHIRMSFAAEVPMIAQAFDRIDQFAAKYDLLD